MLKEARRLSYEKNKERENALAREYHARNREKVLLNQKKYRKNNPEIIKKLRNKHKPTPETQRVRRLKHRYKLHAHEFDLLVLLQGNACAICRKIFEGKNCHVDHNHETGKVRGLLCHNCNVGIGSLQDSASLLRIAASYIEQNLTKEGN